MVEAMKQLYKGHPNSRILACAPSNSAADLLAQRLIDTVSSSEIVRLYAMSRDIKKIPESIRSISNLTSAAKTDLTTIEIMKHRYANGTL